MFRLEHSAMLAERRLKQYSIENCLQKVVEIAQQLGGRSVIAADIGKYGSKSFHWAIKDKDKLAVWINMTKSTMFELGNHTLSFEEWEDSYVKAASGETNIGYIAALQRTIASQADCLVLMGGGCFQDITMQRYAQLHTAEERCIHFVCDEHLSTKKLYTP